MNLTHNKVAFYTLGCKVNQYETEGIKSELIKKGYIEVGFNDIADIYIINSCTVTSIADKKTRNILRRVKKNNKNSILILTGCYAQTNSNELKKIKEIDLIVGNIEKNAMFEIIENYKKNNIEKVLVKDILKHGKYIESDFSVFREMIRAYVKIQDGCNNFCTYCKIPFARGKSRSRDFQSILKEVNILKDEGFKEIIFIGINLGTYGQDLSENKTLEDLLEETSKIQGIERIRLGSVYPDKINDRLISLIKNNSKIMPHLHISLQSGDDEVLEKMGRKYNSEYVYQILKKVTDEISDISLTCDVIVGFPGEKEENFRNTYNLIEKIEFSDIHIFQYSDRENTKALNFTDKVDIKIKKERAENLEKLREILYSKKRMKYINEKMKVLIEEIRDNKSYAYTENYMKVEILGEKYQEKNTIFEVLIKDYKKELLLGV